MSPGLSGLEANAQYLLVVLGLGLLGDLVASRSVNASTGGATQLALVLADAHLGMSYAQRLHARLELDRGLLVFTVDARAADVEGSRRDDPRLGSD